jgi:drug/metabolite transporter superfamily protein YnfA
MLQHLAIWSTFLTAAILEVAGDALIRKGLAAKGLPLIVAGMLLLGFYGVAVNTVKWDFSKMLGVYVAIFASISVLWGRFLFREEVSSSTWIGLLVIIAGGLIIQFGGPR